MKGGGDQSDGADQGYWDGLRAGRLQMPQCSGCGRWHWPAVWRCAECGSWDHAWHEVPITGTVYSWTRNWHPFAGLEGVDIPFVTAVVRLDAADGRRLAGLLRGDEAGLQIGAPVVGEVAVTTFGDTTVPAIRWRLATSSPAASSTALTKEPS